jgi:single-strand DNA-binding protein
MQKCFIIGNATRAPEVKEIGASRVCTFTIAVNSKKKDKELTTFYRINAWGALGDVCAKFVTKGMKCGVAGDLEIQAYTNKNGEAQAIIDVRADNVEFLSSPQGSSGGTTPASVAAKSSKKTAPDPTEDEDELPF